MKDFKILQFIDKFKGIFEKFDVDYEVMRRILQVKLTMDGRRESTIMQGNQSQNQDKKKNDDKNQFYKSLWFYALMGVFLIPFIAMGNSFMFQMSLVFGMIIFMTLTALISDFSSVLLDIRDKGIILTKPVNGRTLSMAKVIHITIYIMFISLALIGPSLVASLFVQGVGFFLIYFIEVILVNLFVISLTALLYLFILRFFDGEKLKDIINYVQIALTMFMVIGYQVLIRLFEYVDLFNGVKLAWYHYLIPPMWFAAPYELVVNGNSNVGIIIMTLLAIIIPIIAIGIYIKLMPAFEKNLQKLSNYSVNGKIKRGLVEKVSTIVCRDSSERSFFNFANKMMTNERDFKLRLYPSLGFAIIFPFIMIYSMYSHELGAIGDSKAYFNIYFGVAYLTMGIYMLKCSANHGGAWVYRIMPTKNLAPVYKGTIKAFIVKFVVPIILLQAVIYTFIFGIKIIPDLVGVILAAIMVVVLFFRCTGKTLPFSTSFKDAPKQSVAIMFGMMGILGLMWGIHYGLTFVPMGSFIYIGALIIGNIIVWKKSFNIVWEEIK
ncbi:MAG: hypothetical protein RR620_02820 [Clostridium sp.]